MGGGDVLVPIHSWSVRMATPAAAHCVPKVSQVVEALLDAATVRCAPSVAVPVACYGRRSMYEYTIVSDRDGVPDLTDLGAGRESVPRRPGDSVQIVFERALDITEFRQYEPAVGVRCRVIRTDEDGTTQERGGAVNRVTPFVGVSLDGEDWH